ncbi:MAG: hypothetical protein RJA10_3648 [Pseudomonadota bacterium]|jgi:hypothetical protein
MSPAGEHHPRHGELHALAARVMIGTAWVAVGLLLGSGLLTEVLAEPNRFSRLRMAFGLILLVAALLARWQQALRPRLASALVLGAALVAAWAHMLFTGIGLHALVLTAALFVITLSGVLCSLRIAVLFAGANAVVLLGAYAGERAGWLRGMAAAADLVASERLIGQLLFTVLALMAAVILTRVINASLGRALQHE